MFSHGFKGWIKSFIFMFVHEHIKISDLFFGFQRQSGAQLFLFRLYAAEGSSGSSSH